MEVYCGIFPVLSATRFRAAKLNLPKGEKIVSFKIKSVKKINPVNVMKPKYDFRNEEKIILRDFLALERTRMSNERTLLAYLRTSLYMLLGGIAFLQLEGFEHMRWLGYVAMALAAILIVTGIVRFYYLRKGMKNHYADAFDPREQSEK